MIQLPFNLRERIAASHESKTLVIDQLDWCQANGHRCWSIDYIGQLRHLECLTILLPLDGELILRHSSNLLSLRTLEIEGGGSITGVKNLWDVVAQIPQLRVLRASRVRLPLFFGEFYLCEGLKKLEEIDLSDCGLTSIPPLILNSSNPRRLILRNNPITEVHRDIQKLWHLTDLNLLETQVKSLPLEITNLSHLTTFLLGDLVNYQKDRPYDLRDALPDDSGYLNGWKSGLGTWLKRFPNGVKAPLPPPPPPESTLLKFKWWRLLRINDGDSLVNIPGRPNFCDEVVPQHLRDSFLLDLDGENLRGDYELAHELYRELMERQSETGSYIMNLRLWAYTCDKAKMFYIKFPDDNNAKIIILISADSTEYAMVAVVGAHPQCETEKFTYCNSHGEGPEFPPIKPSDPKSILKIAKEYFIRFATQWGDEETEGDEVAEYSGHLPAVPVPEPESAAGNFVSEIQESLLALLALARSPRRRVSTAGIANALSGVRWEANYSESVAANRAADDEEVAN